MAIKTAFLLFLLSLFLLSSTLSLAEGDFDVEDNYRGGNLIGVVEEEEEESQSGIPYLFDERSLTTRFRTKEGRISVLESFHQRSKLLRSLKNFRLVLIEANPNAFVLPAHLDADAVLLVTQGKGAIKLIKHDNRESYNIQCGDLIRVPAGTTHYLINRDNNERLRVLKFLNTIGTPGDYREYFPAGGQNPESYLRAFSGDVLQTAFNTRSERVHGVLGKQRKGAIIRASQEQIKELTQQESESRHWHIGRGGGGESSKGPYNMFNRKPNFANNYGQTYVVNPEDYRQLEDMDVTACYANISQGAIMGPFFNTESTKVIVVTGGRGHIEMACPHLSRSGGGGGSGGGRHGEEEEEGVHYKKVRAPLKPVTIFAVPAGHPIVLSASENENLEVFAFGNNAHDNQENFLAGKERNVLRQIERQALELAFDAPRSELEEIIDSQNESVFFPGSRQQQQQQEQQQSRGSTKRQPSLNSILDLVGF